MGGAHALQSSNVGEAHALQSSMLNKNGEWKFRLGLVTSHCSHDEKLLVLCKVPCRTEREWRMELHTGLLSHRTVHTVRDTAATSAGSGTAQSFLASELCMLRSSFLTIPTCFISEAVSGPDPRDTEVRLDPDRPTRSIN